MIAHSVSQAARDHVITPPRSARGRVTGRPGHILVVDDDMIVRDLLEGALTRAGHRVTAAREPSEAFGHLRETDFDVVISDVGMPGMSGLQLLQVIKKNWPQTEVVIATGLTDFNLTLECMRAGAFDFVRKPINVLEVLASISGAVERRQLRAATTLFEASQAIFDTREAEHLPEVITTVAMKAMAADDVSLMLPGTDGHLYLAHSCGLSAQVQAQTRIALGERVAGRIAQDRKPVLISGGASTDGRFDGVPSSGRVQSSIVFPLVAGDRLVGVLNLNRLSAERPFRQSDLDLVAVLASQILLALENARLVRQMMTSERLASIGQLAASVTHEINNPVSYLLSNLEFARERLAKVLQAPSAGRPAGDPTASGPEGAADSVRERVSQLQALLGEVDRALADANEGAFRIQDIIKDMRALARNDERGQHVFDLNDAVRSALRVAGAALRGKAQVTLQLCEGLLVEGNVGRLSQVFVNLLVNAAQAIGEAGGRGTIALSTRRDGDTVVAEVADTGPGIPPELLGKVFEPFFTTKGPTAGTGLGLSVSREIVHRHGGELRVSSTVGVGTRFTLTLAALQVPPLEQAH